MEAAAVSTIMNVYVSQKSPELPAARRLLDEAKARGVRVDVQMYNILIKGYASCSPPQAELAHRVLDEIMAAGLLPSATSVCSVINVYCTLNSESEALELAEFWSGRGVQMSEPMYNTLIKAVSRCRCKRSHGECLCQVCKCCKPGRGMVFAQRVSEPRRTSRALLPRALLPSSPPPLLVLTSSSSSPRSPPPRPPLLVLPTLS